MVFSNHASNQDSNRNDNSSHQNNKANKEGMSLLWTSTIQYPSDDKINPAEAGFFCQNMYVNVKAIFLPDKSALVIFPPVAVFNLIKFSPDLTTARAPDGPFRT